MKIIEILWDKNFKHKKVIEILICNKLWISKSDFFKNYELEINDEIFNDIKNQYLEYQENKRPLEYIIWHVEFFNVKFNVNENTLIPRPETEYMIEAINEEIQLLKNKVNIIDVWTWSWVLWISSKYHNKTSINKILLMDISKKALDVATQNAKRLLEFNENEIKIIESNLLEYFINNIENYSDNKNIIIWNLPYIPNELFDNNVEDNVKKREPRIAFVWWDDWLDLYREMFNQIISYWIEKIDFTMFLEMMTDQINILEKEYWNYFNFSELKTFHFNIKILKVERK